MRERLIAFGLILLLPAVGRAQSATDARDFVTSLYAGYQQGEPDYLGKQARAVFSPRLLGLLRKDAAAAKGEVGTLDGDPICDCQDFGELKVMTIQTAVVGTGRMSATVHFINLGEARTVRLELAAIGGAWRVDDVWTKETPSLVWLLSKAH